MLETYINVDRDGEIVDVPCKIRIDSVFIQPPFAGSPHLCETDRDFYGYEEIEFTVMKRADKEIEYPWLEELMEAACENRIKEEILEYLDKEGEGDK